MIAIKMNFGSKTPTDIVGPTLAATAVALAAAILLDKWYQLRTPRPPASAPSAPPSDT